MATNRYKKSADGGKEPKIRQIEGTLRVLESGNKKLYRVEIQALNGLVNRNGWQYTRLEQHLAEFRDIPILTAYTMGGNSVGDGHNFQMKRDPETGEQYASFTAADAERIVGWVPSDANIRIENIDGIDWVVVTASLWKWYSPELVKKISRQGAMSISIETLVTAEHLEGEVEVEDEYTVLGITVLGDGVAPAVAGANIKSLADLRALRNGMQKEILKAASYVHDNDQKPKSNKTKGVKNSMGDFSKRQLAELNQRFEGYTVLAANEDENGIHICLLTADGNAAIYTLEDINDTIVPEKIARVNATAAFEFGENCVIGVDCADMFDVLNAQIVTLSAELEKANTAVSDTNAALKAMQDAEDARRLSAAKDAAKHTLDAFNAKHEIKVDAKVLDSINADIEKGVYSKCMSAENVWNGDKTVEEKVLAACAREVMAADEKAANDKASIHIWDKIKDSSAAADGSVGSLLARKNIR